jgi:mannose-6-phosphate isomerase
MDWSPLKFEPIFKERVWGGRNLERLYHKALPVGKAIGESWELCDRPGESNRVIRGGFAGKTLRWLIETHPEELLGVTNADRFPLLVKVLDANERLSLQVHPPAEVAKRLGGEPKSEMWFVAEAAENAKLYVGLKSGVTREQFELKCQNGSVADCFHQISSKRNDAIFLQSGRVHALGEGNVIFEIQQNSDTTYRVFDWNRLGLDGVPRKLHLSESLDSIDFRDFEPSLINHAFEERRGLKSRLLTESDVFDVWEWRTGEELVRLNHDTQGRCVVVGVVEGHVTVGDVDVGCGEFVLIPAITKSIQFAVGASSTLLLASPII